MKKKFKNFYVLNGNIIHYDLRSLEMRKQNFAAFDVLL